MQDRPTTFKLAAASGYPSPMRGGIAELPGALGHDTSGAPAFRSALSATGLASFGLQNQSLQHALSSMLKAIVSLSEDHQSVKKQLETYQTASRDAQFAIARDMDAVSSRVAKDCVTRKEWSEGRYDDQRRTDRVASSLNNFSQDQLAEMRSLLTRVANLEALTASMRKDVAEVHVTTAAQINQSLEARDASIAQQATATASRISAVHRSIEALQAELAAQVEKNRKDERSITDQIAGILRDVHKWGHGHEQVVLDVSTVSERLQQVAGRVQAAEDRHREEIAGLVTSIDTRLAAVEKTVQWDAKQVEERLTKAENAFHCREAELQCAVDSHTHILRSVLPDHETVKKELSALLNDYDGLRESIDEASMKSASFTNDKIDAALTMIRAEIGAAVAKSHDAVIEVTGKRCGETIDSLVQRLQVTEAQRRLDDATFRNQVQLSLAERATVDSVAEMERERNERMHRLDSELLRLHGAFEKFTACEEAVASVQCDVDRLWNEVGEAKSTLSTVLDVFALDPAAIPRRLDGDDKDAVRAMINRYIRSLPWWPSDAANAPGSPSKGGIDKSAVEARSFSPRSPLEDMTRTGIVDDTSPRNQRWVHHRKIATPVVEDRRVLLSIPRSSRGPLLGIEINDDPQRRGVAVVRVDPGGNADRAGLRLGDVVTMVSGTPITSKQDFIDAFARCVAQEEPAVVATVIPGGRRTAAEKDLTLFFGHRRA